MEKRVFNKNILSFFIMLNVFFIFVGVSVPLKAENDFSKNEFMTLTMEKKTIKNVLNYIEENSRYVFAYSTDLLPFLQREVSISTTNESVENILKMLSKKTDLYFDIKDRQITITAPKRQQRDQKISREMIDLSGVVLDESGQTVIGASVVVKGNKTHGTITDFDGHFKLSTWSDATLIISYIGYSNLEVSVKGKTQLSLKLKPSTNALEEVVVIAYGTQSKATLTGALSTINNKELSKAPVASITNVMAGALPGVSTVQNSGQPGADAAAIYVRGTRPLILVDGVERSFSEIDPNEIESLSVLKDASSTAVFGVRGANGVVLITTKRGKMGKPSVHVSSLTGVQQPCNFVSPSNSYQFAKFWNLKQQNDRVVDKAQYFTREAIEAYRIGSDPIMFPSIKWGDYMYRKSFLQSKNNVNISGGNDRVNYFISLGYLYQDGLLKQFSEMPFKNNFSYNRYNYRANLDFTLTKSTSLKLNIGGHVGKTREPRVIEDIYNPFVFTQIWCLPFGGPGFINGKRTVLPAGMTPLPVSRDGLATYWGTGYDQKYRTTLNTDLILSQKLDVITKGLSVSLKGSYDNVFTLNKHRKGGEIESQIAYYKSFLTNKNKPMTDPDYDKTVVYVPTGKVTPLIYDESYGRDRNWYLEARVNYNRTFNRVHKISGLFLYNQSRNYYPSNDYVYMPRGYVGFVGRLTYGYKSKYLMDVNIGYNGSENFAPGKNRYGLFPALSIGWVASEEDFMQSQNVIDYLKIRVSKGRVGSDVGSSRFMYMPGVWSGSGSYSFGIANPIGSPASVLANPGNYNVSWETADKENYGIDIRALNSRLSFNLDFFTEKRRDILISPRSIPSVIATSLPNLNMGKVDYSGYEVNLGWDETLNNKLRYYINANVSFAHDKIIFMDEVPNKYDYMNFTGGSSGRQGNLFVYDRLYQYSDFTKDESGDLVLNKNLAQPSVTVYPGDAKYNDLNGDNIVDVDDRCVSGYAQHPEYILGLNGGLNYKGFSLSMQWVGATNVDKMLEVEYRIPFTNAGNRGLSRYFYDKCWTEENQLGASLPRAAETSETWNAQNSTLWLRDASYLRLKTLSIGYTFTKRKWLSTFGAKSLGLSLNGYNLLTFSPLKIMDPESLGNNRGGYPLVKVYSLGLNINF